MQDVASHSADQDCCLPLIMESCLFPVFKVVQQLCSRTCMTGGKPGAVVHRAHVDCNVLLPAIMWFKSAFTMDEKAVLLKSRQALSAISNGLALLPRYVVWLILVFCTYASYMAHTGIWCSASTAERGE